MEPDYNNISVLVVDDSPTQAEQLRSLLSSHGFTVMVASDGFEALKIISRSPPSLVLSDIVMPMMDGYQLCAAIRANRQTSNLPVVLLTSLSKTEDILHALECGADYFISKPYNEEYLLSRMKNIIDSITLRIRKDNEPESEIIFNGRRFFIKSDMQRALDLLMSTYETVVLKNRELQTMQNSLSDKVLDLEQALAQVKQLEGIIPICMHCKKIRDDKNSWQQLEQYISDHSEALFSHGVCPQCLASHYSHIEQISKPETKDIA